MLHSKGFYTSLDPEEAIEYLYREIKELERKIQEVEDRIYRIEQEVGE